MKQRIIMIQGGDRVIFTCKDSAAISNISGTVYSDEGLVFQLLAMVLPT